ncbi:MAG: hypothetical protein ACRD8Z_23350, partial [Nitrososphaeraceae archaeon]
FFFLCVDDDSDDKGSSSGPILTHITSDMQYEKSTPVTSDIKLSQKRMQYSLAFSIKHGLLITQ